MRRGDKPKRGVGFEAGVDADKLHHSAVGDLEKRRAVREVQEKIRSCTGTRTASRTIDKRAGLIGGDSGKEAAFTEATIDIHRHESIRVRNENSAGGLRGVARRIRCDTGEEACLKISDRGGHEHDPVAASGGRGQSERGRAFPNDHGGDANIVACEESHAERAGSVERAGRFDSDVGDRGRLSVRHSVGELDHAIEPLGDQRTRWIVHGSLGVGGAEREQGQPVVRSTGGESIVLGTLQLIVNAGRGVPPEPPGVVGADRPQINHAQVRREGVQCNPQEHEPGPNPNG